ncbi:MAG: glucans biosynthesis glucosyltransferase MdoH, partial [Noviherbaspirillum sp.]
MELHTARRLKRDPAASILCNRYLDRLPLNADTRHTLATHIDTDGATPREAMAGLHRALAGKCAPSDEPAYASVASRLRLAYDRRAPQAQSGNVRTLDIERRKHTHLLLAPPPNRSPMVPHPWGPLNPLVRWWQSLLRRRSHWVERKDGDRGRRPWPAARRDSVSEDVTDAPDPRGGWQRNGNIRRVVLLTLMLAQTALATHFMRLVLPYQGTTPPELALVALFAVLFCWVSAGFWTAMT